MKKPCAETDIALIKNNIGYIQLDISEIKNSLKGLNSIFASKEQLLEVAKQVELRLQILENANTWRKWFVPLVTAISSSTVTFLIIQYLEKI